MLYVFTFAGCILLQLKVGQVLQQPHLPSNHRQNTGIGRFKGSAIVLNHVNGSGRLSLESTNHHTFTVNVTRFNKTDRLVTFCISRNTKLKYSNHCGSFLLESSYIKFTA